MSVRSEAPKDGQVIRDQVSDAAQQLAWRAAGLFAIVVGGAFWLIGARYTVFGAPLVIAHLLGLFGIVAPITLPIGWPLLASTVGVGAIVSLMEFGARPRRAFFAKSLLLGTVLVFLWALVNTGDFASTALAVFYPGAGASAAARWAASTSWAAIPWICFLTWTPELLINAGCTMIWHCSSNHEQRDRVQTVTKRHGRLETRTLECSTAGADYLVWPGIAQIMRRTCERTMVKTGKHSVEVSYGLTNLGCDEAQAEQLEALWRGHSPIENRKH